MTRPAKRWRTTILTAMLLCGVTFIAQTVRGSDIYFYLNMRGSYSTRDKSLTVGVNGRGVNRMTFRLIRVEPAELIKNSETRDISDLTDLQLKNGKLVKKWKEKYKVKINEWNSHETKFDSPGPGVYILEASSGGAARTVMFFVTDIAVMARWDRSRALFFVVDRSTGKPQAGANVTVYFKGKKPFSGTTKSDGLVVLDGAFSETTPVIAARDGHIALLNIWPGYYGDREGYNVLTYTDRPVYRPSQTVQFRGIARRMVDTGYELPNDKEVDFIVRDPKGNEILREKRPLSDFGTFFAKIQLGDEPPLGEYSVLTNIGGREYWGSGFSVEEYRKPEVEVTVEPDRNYFVRGDDVSFSVSAKYYFGEPVKDAKIKYEVRRSPIGWYWWYSDYGRRPMRDNDVVASGEGALGADGKFVIRAKGDTPQGFDYTYSVNVGVTDKGGRQVDASSSTRLMQGAFAIDVSVSPYFVRTGQKEIITVRTSSHDGGPVSQKVTMRIERRDWSRDREIRKTVLEKTIETASDGAASVSFTPDETGSYLVSVESKDDRGNDLKSATYFYVSGAGYAYWWSPDTGVKVMLDKDEYKPGDTARIMIIPTMKSAAALVTVEADRIYRYAVLPLDSGAASWEFPVEASMVPNAVVKVALISEDQAYYGDGDLNVPPKDKMLTISLSPNRDIYKPGEQATYNVTALDNEGRPAVAELSLGVVDESLYAVKPERVGPMKDFFYSRRYSQIGSADSLQFYSYGQGAVKGKMAMDSEAPRPAAAMMMEKSAAPREGMKEEYAVAVIRGYFPDTAFWSPSVTTDAQGRAKVEFKMPDTLTTWRATARAVTKDTKVGEATAKVIVKKNLLVRLETPRFFTQKDRVAVPAVVHNYLSTAKRVKMQLNAKGLKLEGDNTQYVDVAPGADARVEWRVEVEAPQTAWVTVKALTDEESDAVQLEIPVLPHGIASVDTRAGIVEDRADRVDLKIPGDTVPGTVALSIDAAPSIAGDMFKSLDYLAGYPYGCVEQTMSRFLPDVVVAQTLQKLGRDPKSVIPELDKMVDKGLQRLYGFQHGDGGWGWWEKDDTHPYMTAYVMYGFALADAADVKVDPGVFARGLESLKAQFKAQKDLNTRVYMLYALDLGGAPDARAARDLYELADGMNPYTRALLAMTLAHTGEKYKSQQLVARLVKEAQKTGALASWGGKSWHYSWTDNEIETTAYVLKALIELRPDSPLIPAAVRYLTLNRRGDAWYSTKDTAAAVFAMSDYVARFEAEAPDYEMTIRVNGAVAKKVRFTPADRFGRGVKVDVDPATLAPGKKMAIEISRDGKGRAYYTAKLTYYLDRSFIKAADQGFQVSRAYTSDAEGKKPLRNGETLKQGQEIWALITVKPKVAAEYAMLEDMLPSGFEVVKETWEDRHYSGPWNWWFAQKETRDEKVSWFITRMTSGQEYKFSYRLRAESPGEVRALPAAASLMYFPAVRGNSDEFAFKVK